MNTKLYKDSNPVVTMKIKGYGDILIELFPEVAPNTVKNFVNLIEQEYYTDSKFHRVIKGFMIQGGQGKTPAKAIRGEFGANGHQNPLKHSRGVISMARTNNPNSASSQFFLMHQDSPHLDNQYASFGIIIKGIEIVDEIANVKTGSSDVPNVDVVIDSMTVDTKGFNYTNVDFV